MNAARAPAADALLALLTGTLGLWDVDGAVERGPAPALATVRTARATVAIERVDDRAVPFRWRVRWRAAGEKAPGARERHPRLCASLGGVLSALRAALGVEGGAALRVASAPRGEAAAQRSRLTTGTRVSAPASHLGRTPITLITGFLGSGKTTLLSRLLRDPALARTAVIINEFGEIGLDHDLVEASDENLVQLSSGCLCCKVRSDLVLTLVDLAARRAAGALPPFKRVVIETTGLADPAPILHALATDATVAETYAIGGVVTTVDALAGASTFERHAEAVKQAAFADCIVLTKTDVAEADAAALVAAARAVNRDAPIVRAAEAGFDAAALLKPERRMQKPPAAAHGVEPPHDHLHGIASVSIVREAPVRAATLPLFLAALAESCGADLLRVKGIAAVAGLPDTPAVIHGVQHVYHAPSWLERWPSDDRRTRIVLIGRRLDAAWTGALLDLLDAEVAEECEARAHAVALHASPGSPVA